MLCGHSHDTWLYCVAWPLSCCFVSLYMLHLYNAVLPHAWCLAITCITLLAMLWVCHTILHGCACYCSTALTLLLHLLFWSSIIILTCQSDTAQGISQSMFHWLQSVMKSGQVFVIHVGLYPGSKLAMHMRVISRDSMGINICPHEVRIRVMSRTTELTRLKEKPCFDLLVYICVYAKLKVYLR